MILWHSSAQAKHWLFLYVSLLCRFALISSYSVGGMKIQRRGWIETLYVALGGFFVRSQHLL